MATFTGTNADEIITTGFVSPTVVANPVGSLPSNADDEILAGAGVDTINSGGGNDTVTGGQGNDSAVLGEGDDTFIWRPGDGSDIVEGGTGSDTMDFFGSNASENITIMANGPRALFFRDVANITMDLNDVENILFHAFGGADTINVEFVAGTDLARIDVNLEGVLGSGVGDGAADEVGIAGTLGDDTISIGANGSLVTVDGLSAQVNVLNSEAANDSLVVLGFGGNDTISAAGLANSLIHLTIGGGTGDDTITGGRFADTLQGNEGNDTIRGEGGNDTAFLGANNDRFIWIPGDGSDVVEGQDGLDTLVFDGSNANENFNLSANGGRVVFFRDVANITMDMDDVETLELKGFGGTNALTIGNLTGTDMEGAISYTGGTGVDTIGAAAAINAITALGGDGTDVFTTGLGTDTLSGGAGDDIINSGGGNDIVIGGAGADSMTGGGDSDLFRYVAGTDAVTTEIVNGQGGTDALQLVNTGAIDFSGVSISDVEELRFLSGNSSASFGAGQLGGTGITDVIGSTGTDTVTVTGSTVNLSALEVSLWNDAVDTFFLVGTTGADNLTGTNRRDVLNGGAGTDTLNGGLGNDVYVLGAGSDTISDTGGTDIVYSTITRSLGSLPAIENLTLFGNANINGSGNGGSNSIIGNGAKNILIGRAGNDSLNGGSGNDVLIGSNGHDLLKGGIGNDRFDFNTTFETGKTPGTRDKILDFAHGKDKIDLSSIDANGSAAGNGKFSFLAAEGAAFTGVRGELRWDQQNNAGTANDRTVISGDLNGNGSADFQIELAGLKVLSVSDFVL